MSEERFRYCGGKMMPKGSMGYVESGELPPKGGAEEAGKVQRFASGRVYEMHPARSKVEVVGQAWMGSAKKLKDLVFNRNGVGVTAWVWRAEAMARREERKRLDETPGCASSGIFWKHVAWALGV